jgi:hypothetical protein
MIREEVASGVNIQVTVPLECYPFYIGIDKLGTMPIPDQPKFTLTFAY